MVLRSDRSNAPIAIIGMACRLPGAANLEEYWRLICEGRSAVAEVPPERLDQSLYYDPRRGVRGKTYSKRAALLANRDFDRARCPLPDALVESVDNTHLLMTGVAAEALRHARLDPFHLPERNAAVFIGHAQGSSRLGELTYDTNLDAALALLESTEGFQDLPPEERDAIRREIAARIRSQLPGGSDNGRYLHCNMVSGTIAKAFGLNGPWLALNSACASSLHAMLMGARALQRGRAEMAIVGGASDCKSDSLVLFSNAQAMSASESRPFDAEADGLIMSEGYVALVMKTLDRALADGDPIQAVVRGLGAATDGRGKSLWAPRKEGQIKAMRRAYRSGVEMERLQYLECHATATQLGDATELNTLAEVLGEKFPAGRRIPITSVKANIGHSLEAAGVAGVIKTVLCMQHRVIPPAINIRSLNQQIDWDASPYYVPQTPAPWEAPQDGGPRRAGVNAFGIGGLNMHVVLDEYTEQSVLRVPAQRVAPRESADDRAVAIVGMSCILPGAANLSQFWRALLDGRDPKSAPPAERWPAEAAQNEPALQRPIRGGFVTDYQYDWRKHKVPPKQVAEADPLQFMLLDASEQALSDAGYDRESINRETCGVVVGTEFGGDFSDQLEMGLRLPEMQRELAESLRRRGAPAEKIERVTAKFADVLLKKWPSLIDETGSFTSSTLASRISKTLDLAGGAVAIDSGATSAMSAVAQCVDSLLSGDNDLMICAAGQRRMGPSAYKALASAGILAGDPSPRGVLDAGYGGVVPGEGAAAVVLKRLADARRDGDRIHAVIRGIGAAHDHDSPAEAMRLATARACEMAGVEPHEIAFVEIDTDEPPAVMSEGLKVFAAPRDQPLALGSATAQFGQLGGAGAMAALVKAGLEFDHDQLAPAFGLEQPSPALGAARPLQAAEKLAGRRLGAIASWSKGMAFHLILEHGLPVAPPVAEVARLPGALGDAAGSLATSATANSKSLPKICRFGAASFTQLQAQLAAIQNDVAGAWRAADARHFAPDERARLAVVADGPEQLGQKLRRALPQLQNPTARHVLEQQGVFYRELPPKRPRVALVFPGQGSQYDGMLKDLVRDLPAAARMLDEADAAMRRCGESTFAELAWSATTRLGDDVWSTQAAMLLADAVCLAALRDRGIAYDLVLGHSFGEFAALYAAGAWDLETAIRMTRARCDGIGAVAVGGAGMLATNAPPETIEAIFAQTHCQAYLANFNAPDQTVVGGKLRQLEKLAEALQAASFQARVLAVPAAFHTPLMAGASRMLERALATADIRPPQTPLWSTVDNRLVGDADQIRRNLGKQLTTPVRYTQLIAQLAAEAPTVFVEVGPQQTLTRLNRRIVDAATPVIALDNPKRPGLEPLLCVQALLECLGARGEAASAPAAQPSLLLSGMEGTAETTAVQERPARSAEATVSSSDMKGVAETTVMEDQIPHFDATARRRAKMRGAAAGGPEANGGGAAPPRTPAVERPPAPPQAPPPPPSPNPLSATPAPAPAPTPAPAPQPAPAAPAPAISGGDLESFLINFVVEQTGYPPEVVELDADLEADLGIDSIKKAQLFGELQEYFDIGATATGELSLDDFPTLRHVLNFLAAGTPAASIPAPASPAPSAPAPTPQASQPALVPAAQPSAAGAAELESFLVNFVVEQTGYPPEVVELDADLEADLGIDSIKKAQLFGELQEYFDIGATATGELSLDDFPTLRHVLNFLASHASPAAADEAPASPAPTLVDPASFAPAPAPQASQPAPAEQSSSANAAELESFLVNFVVEQTGYPPEVVELDADLEADLGIDSIKKAQLFGELQEYFDIGATATGELSLDDFPTLRHVLNFLASNASPAANDNAASFSTAEPTPALEKNSNELASAAASIRSSTADAAELEAEPATPVAGTPYELGWRHGLRWKARIQRMLRRYAEYAGADLGELPGQSDLPVESRLSADELDELQGLADAAEMPLGNLLAHHFAVAAECGGAEQSATDGAQPETQFLHALRQPLPACGPLRESAEPEVFLRSPTRGLAHLAVAYVGSAHLLGGLNAAGVAITASPLADSGRHTPCAGSTSLLVREVLENAADLEHALALLGSHVGAQPWRACLSDGPAGRIALAEFDGATLRVESDVPRVGDALAHAGSSATSATANGHVARASTNGASVSTLEPAALVRSLNGLDGAARGADSFALLIEPTRGLLRLRGATTREATLAVDDIASRKSSSRRATPLRERHPQVVDLRLNGAISSNLKGGSSDVTSRFALEMRDAPLPAGANTEPTWTGAAIILGENATAEALARRLAASGVTTHRLSPERDDDAVLAELEEICRSAAAPHLFITTARDTSPLDPRDEEQWTRQRRAAMALPLFVCQKWLQLAAEGKWLDRCTLVATTAQEGDFGFARGARGAQGGALAGLLKAVFIEYTVMQGLRNLRVKVIDAPEALPADELAGCVFQELASGNLDYEVAYDGQTRRVPFAVEQPAAASQTPAVRRGATWVVTGGARGITAACALELGKRYGLNLHLIGASPLPEVDPAWRDLSEESLKQLKASTMIAARKAGQPAAAAWQDVQKRLEIDRSLRALETAGVRATYHACDVSDRAALARVLDEIRRIDGPIEGVLHGAGIDHSCRFDRKQRDVVLRTIGAKVDGAANLMALTERDPVRHFLGFGSISGRLGSFGQTDYALASDMLCKLLGAYRRRRPWVKAVGFHWHPWDEVGMAARPETRSVLQGKSDLRLMPLQEGLAHLVRELEAGAPHAEVLITERRHWQRFAEGLGQLAEGREGEGARGRVHEARVSPSPTPPLSPPPEARREPRTPEEEVELRTHRCELRTLDAPLPADAPAVPTFDSPVWILGDNAAARALQARLQGAGATVHQLRGADIEQVSAEMDRLWAERPAKYLFLMSGRDEPPADPLDAEQASRRRQEGILLPFFAARRWYQLLLGRSELGPGTLAAAVSLGGDMGFGGRAVLPDGGALCGLLKAIHIESSRREGRSARTKVIDAPADESPEALADALLRELAADEPEVEVCWSRGARRVVRPLPAPLGPLAQPRDLRGGTWVATGGARGITAIAARELARRHGWRVHLLGLSPAPRADAAWRNYSEAEMKALKTRLAREAVAEGRSPSEAWDRVMKDVEIYNNLRQFADAGVEATYHACDISDREALARTLDEIRRQDGPIHGILHGAGMIDPGRFEHKRPAFVEKLVRAKYDGLMNLVALTWNDPLAYCVGFGSISGRFGGNGLSDYAAGNDAMAKLLDWLRAARPDCAAACVHWESWEGSGMATLPRFAWGPKSVMNMKYMMPEEGARRLEQELQAGLPDGEVLYTFGDFYPMFYPAEQRPLGAFTPGPLDGGANEKNDEHDAEPRRPLLAAVRATETGRVGDVPLDPRSDAFLIQHRLRDKPLLPVVVGLEALAEIAIGDDSRGATPPRTRHPQVVDLRLDDVNAKSGHHVVGFENIQMLDGMLFHTDAAVTAQAEAKSVGGDRADCSLTCDFRNRAGKLIQKDRPYLRARVVLSDRPAALPAEAGEVPSEWTEFSYPEGGMVYHGPAFRGVTAVSLRPDGGWGRIAAPPLRDLTGPARVEGWNIPSNVLDAALYACGIHLWLHGDGAISLPRSIESLRLGRQPRDGETCLCRVFCRGIAADGAEYDFTVLGEDGAVVLQARGYRKVILTRGGGA